MSAQQNSEDSSHADPEAALEETRRVRSLQRVVALAQQTLATQVRTKGEALAVINGVRAYALKLFPDGGETFDLIYRSRLLRIYRERFETGPEDSENDG